ncbi:hypothetical protein [Pseudoclavibacter sp. 8L]|uniref:hypothetical protein n=1 Tax=Pseudoclavibacter sp. 8L TaxID=2653162 RepID=UPI0012F0114F|nr:hypothetical protein [Pseudoclavibacter sp. 8L]VXB32503.1 conserved hypothetical protein [Pseudoclavibacter sp. 8L]
MWKFWICDSITGVKLREVFPEDGTWKTLMNGVGSGNHTFSMADEVERLVANGMPRSAATEEVRTVWPELLDPDGWKPALVVCWGDVPVYAGLLQRQVGAGATNKVTVNHVEVRALMDERLMHPVGDPTRGNFVLFGVNARTAAAQIIRKALGPYLNGWDFRPRWDVRLTPYTPEPGTFEMPVKAFEVQNGEQLLTLIQDDEGGPDIHFRPRWRESDQGLEWEDRRGSPRLSAGTHEFVIGAEENGASDVSFITDAKNQATGAHVVGKGTEEDMRRGWGTEQLPLGTGWLLDKVLSLKHISDPLTLDSHGRAFVKAHKHATRQFSMSVRADGSPSGGLLGPTAAQIMPGTVMRVLPSNSLILRDEWLDGYVIGVSGDMGMDLKLDFQEV